MTLPNGVVAHVAGEGDYVFPDRSRFRNTFEECFFPLGGGSYLCSEEWVTVEGVRYRRSATSEGPGQWEIVQDMAALPTSPEVPPSPLEVLEHLKSVYGLVELERESIAGVAYRRFKAPWNPSQLMLERLEAGEWEPPKELPKGVSREDVIDVLRSQAEAQTGTVELWARENDYTVWKTVREVKTLDIDSFSAGRYPVVRKSTSTEEYSRFNEPVVIESPN
jgi:hypothetical protein